MLLLLILSLLLILFFILSFEKLSIANNISSEVDKISKNLRCLICQGQSVYDSQSDFAISMKLLIKKIRLLQFYFVIKTITSN